LLAHSSLSSAEQASQQTLPPIHVTECSSTIFLAGFGLEATEDPQDALEVDSSSFEASLTQQAHSSPQLLDYAGVGSA
jgi:hypothetical protein